MWFWSPQRILTKSRLHHPSQVVVNRIKHSHTQKKRCISFSARTSDVYVSVAQQEVGGRDVVCLSESTRWWKYHSQALRTDFFSVSSCLFTTIHKVWKNKFIQVEMQIYFNFHKVGKQHFWNKAQQWFLVCLSSLLETQLPSFHLLNRLSEIKRHSWIK